MHEVEPVTVRQRKNYLFYCFLYLFRSDDRDISKYYEFLLGLAGKYFKDVYLMAEKLNQINTPNPGSFDETDLINEVEKYPTMRNAVLASAFEGMPSDINIVH